MKVNYDSNSLSWFQSSLTDQLTIGGNKQIIGYRNKGSDSISFAMRLNNNHIGPLIGILTTLKPNGSIAGNSPLFIEIQKKLISLDGICFVFTPEGVDKEFIRGYTFIPDKNSWAKVRFPYPDLVYNRIPFRQSEQDNQSQDFFSTLREKGIPFFNPCFIDKYELYCLLETHPSLHKYLPRTILINEKKALSIFFKKYKRIYLKPTQSAKGKGIFRIKLAADRQIQLEGLNKVESYRSFDHFWEAWVKISQNKSYLAQEEIKSIQYEGNRYDFRILAHAENSGYRVTGVGIRQSLEQNITTHIPAGGILLPYQLFQTVEHDHFIDTTVNQIGKALTNVFGYFGEFSIDAGISDAGHYYLYEVNSKPMSFDEIDIEKRKIEQLCQLFLQLTNF
ncbi:MAG TPA: YheC/YheD family protein [Neobacillus sp.]